MRHVQGPSTPSARRRSSIVAVLAGFAAAAAATAAVTVSSRVTAAPVAAQVRVENGALHLRLDEAVAIALERNLALRVQQFDREQARLGIDQAMGIYDFSLQGGLSASDDTTPAASNLDGADVQKLKRHGLQLGLGRLLPSGATASVVWGNQRLETNSRFALLNPSYSTSLDLNFSQPLLRGFGRAVIERPLVIARIGDEISDQAFALRVIETVREVENAYWSLVGARAQLTVAETALNLAKKLHEQNRVRVDVGTLAPLELLQSEVGVATRDEEIIRARFAVGDAEDRLRAVLNLDQGSLWAAAIVPETEAETARPSIDVEGAIVSALAQRPELASQKLGLQQAEIDATYYRNQALPRLDLQASYGLNGVGGDVIVRDSSGQVVEVVSGGWSDAMQQIGDADFRGWTIGLTFAYPLENRAARAQQTIADLEIGRARAALDGLVLAVSTDVRTKARLVESAAKAIDSARTSVRATERNLEAEQKKYENGLSTSFQVLQVQDDLTAARNRLVQSVVGYRRALVEFYQATGALLRESGVEIAGGSVPTQP